MRKYSVFDILYLRLGEAMLTNPYLYTFISILVSAGLYYLLSDSHYKKRIVDQFSETFFNVVVVSVIFNALLSFQQIFKEPYTLVFLKPSAIQIGIIVVLTISLIRKHKSLYSNSEIYQEFMLLLGLILLINQVRNYLLIPNINFLIISLLYFLLVTVVVFKKLTLSQLNIWFLMLLFIPLLILGSKTMLLFNHPIGFYTQFFMIGIVMWFHLFKGDTL